MKRILLIEDDELLRKALVRHLRRRGYEVEEANTLEAARYLLKARSASIDVVVSDIDLPDGKSPTLHAEQDIQEILTTRRIGWVAISAWAGDFDAPRQYFVDRGITLVRKPIEPMSRLFDAIEAAYIPRT